MSLIEEITEGIEGVFRKALEGSCTSAAGEPNNRELEILRKLGRFLNEMNELEEYYAERDRAAANIDTEARKG